MAKMTVKVDGADVFVLGLTKLNVEKIRDEGRSAEVLRKVVDDARRLCEKESDYHSSYYVLWLEKRLAEEIKWGHRKCEDGNCKSSGTDCPRN